MDQSPTSIRALADRTRLSGIGDLAGGWSLDTQANSAAAEQPVPPSPRVPLVEGGCTVACRASRLDSIQAELVAVAAGSSERLLAAFAKVDDSRHGILSPRDFIYVLRMLGIEVEDTLLQGLAPTNGGS
jgi:hypothetical protein